MNLGSFSSLLPSPLLAVYSGSKAFLHTFSQALGSELEDYNITVSLINAYFVVSALILPHFLPLTLDWTGLEALENPTSVSNDADRSNLRKVGLEPHWYACWRRSSSTLHVDTFPRTRYHAILYRSRRHLAYVVRFQQSEASVCELDLTDRRV